MILDKQNMFSQAQGPISATAAATNIVDLGPGDTGPSERLSLFVTADPPFTVTGVNAATITVELQTADAQAAGVLTSPATVASFLVTKDAIQAGGKLVAARLPHGMKRYAGLNYTVTTGASTTIAAGKLTAGLVYDVEASL
ncbi:MAG: hypothetical protein LBR82_00245 [Desulfovibrio sp.]|jgi:hypothetical protein|nr:hypothetical protein [Desulfovibrio sp.]